MAGSFFERQVKMERAQELLGEVVAEVLGPDAAIRIERVEVGASSGAPRTVYEEQELQQRLEVERRRRAVEEHPLVRAMVDELGAEILRIRPPEKKGAG